MSAGRFFDTISGEVAAAAPLLVRKERENVIGPYKSHHGLTFTPDCKFLASGSLDKSARLWNIAEGTAKEFKAAQRGAGFSVAVSPDGALLAVRTSI